MIHDTIAAVSTPRGKGGVALLRVSGADAVAICDRVFAARNGKPLAEAEARRAVYGSVFAVGADGERRALDDVLATVFRAPASFTGEDTVEITCHGGLLLTETVLTALLVAGARPAQAGEFTRRAFLNGKMGLSAAEALGDLLDARTQEQILLAHSGLQGKTERACEDVYAGLRHLLASVYVRIDYPDEDLAELSVDQMLDQVREGIDDLKKLSDTYRTGHAVAEGISTVICGRPNVGKSSLYNRILGRDAAIVTDIEGTTRDVLTETAALGRVTLRLSDTAGLHRTSDRVEQIGIERAKGELKQAELILALFDASSDVADADRELCETVLSSCGVAIAVLNKSDRANGEIPAFFRERFDHSVAISALDGRGMDDLTALVERLFTDGKLDLGRDAVLANARQHAAVQKALSALEKAEETLVCGLPMELCCSDVEAAMESLCELDGRAVSEDLVSEIFSHFCVGK